jgi:translation initiation factor IF-1
MSIAHTTTFEAMVIAELPQHLYRVELPSSKEGVAGGPVITAGLSDEARRLGVQVRTGQRVLVRRASRDPGRGIITGLSARA